MGGEACAGICSTKTNEKTWLQHTNRINSKRARIGCFFLIFLSHSSFFFFRFPISLSSSFFSPVQIFPKQCKLHSDLLFGWRKMPGNCHESTRELMSLVLHCVLFIYLLLLLFMNHCFSFVVPCFYKQAYYCKGEMKYF